MLKLLTQAQIDQYRKDGFVFPVRVMSEDAALECRRRLEAFEAATGGPLRGDLRHKSHLLFTWLADLICHQKVLDAVEDLYGPDLFCRTTNFFIKKPNTPDYVSWRQDSTYWGLSSPDVVTAWIALTPSGETNGANAMLVRGVDVYRHFVHEPRPTSDMAPEFLALHRQIAERTAQIMYSGTDIKSYNDPAALRRTG